MFYVGRSRRAKVVTRLRMAALQIRLDEIDSLHEAKNEAEKVLFENGLGSRLQRIRTTLGNLAAWSLTVGDREIHNVAFTGAPFRWKTIGGDEPVRVHRRYDPQFGRDAERKP